MPQRYALRAFGGPVLYTPIIPPPPPPPPAKLYGYTVIAGGEERFCIAGSLQIESKIGKRSQASCKLLTSTGVHFQQDERLQIFNADGTIVFNGYIDKPKEQKKGFQKSLIHTITAVDGHRLADKRRVAKLYQNKTAAAIVYDIWNTILRLEGVSIGAIFDGPTPSQYLYPSETLYPGESVVATIPSVVFAYCKVSEALDELAKRSSYAGVPYYWQIDEQLRLWFVPYTYVRYPLIVDGNNINENAITVTRNNPSYFNDKWVTGATVETDPQVETRKGDGETTTWDMAYKLARVPTVSVNGVAKTVGIGQVDKNKDFYWNAGSTTISQDSSGTKLLSPDDPGGPDILSVTYIGSFPTIFHAQDPAQIAYEADLDGSTGIVEDVEENTSITTFDAGINYVSEALARYAKQGIELDFETRDSVYQQGQLLTVSFPDFDLNQTEFLIESVTASDSKDTVNMWFTVHAVAGPADSTWVDFFSALLKTPQKPENISVGVSQVLNTLQPFTATVNCTAVLRIKALGGLVPSETLYPSNDLFPA